ncbi:hypothetical protein Bca101_010243 [Brassica carinata]
MNDHAELPLFPDPLVGGHARPHRFSADPFSSPVPAWMEIPGADREAVPMAPLKHPCPYLFDDGSRSEIREVDLMEIRRRYGVSPMVRMRCPSEYERAPDGGDNEIAVFEAYLEAGFRGVIPFLVAAVSSYFGFCPSQLTPLTWRTLMALQVLGEFHGFSVGVHEVLYLYHFAPLVSKPGFYHLCSCDGSPFVDEPSRGLRGNYPIGDDLDKWYVFVKVPGPLSYPTLWRTLARAIPRATGLSSSSQRNFEAAPNQDLETGAHQGLLGEMLFLRIQVQDMMVQRDLLIQRVRAFARWELMREWLEKTTDHWDRVGEYRRYLLLFGDVERPLGGSVRADNPRSVPESSWFEWNGKWSIEVSERVDAEYWEQLKDEEDQSDSRSLDINLGTFPKVFGDITWSSVKTKPRWFGGTRFWSIWSKMANRVKRKPNQDVQAWDLDSMEFLRYIFKEL